MKTIHLPALQTQMYLSGSIQVHQEAATYVSQLNTRKIAAGENSPAVCYREGVNVLTIEGNVSSEYAIDTMNRAINMVNKHFAAYEGLSLVMNIAKINTSGVKMMMNLLNKLKNYIAKGKEVKVVWILSERDEEMIDLAVDMINLYGINIDMRLR